MGQIILPTGAAPSTPAAGNTAFYVKTDGMLYFKDSAGVEHAAGVDAVISGIQAQIYTAFTTAGTSTAYTLTPTPAITSYAAGTSFYATFHAASGAAPTLAISGLATPPNLVKQLADGTYANIAAGDIPISHRSRVTLLNATQALVEIVPTPLTGVTTAAAALVNLGLSAPINHIGVPGTAGFGVGICPNPAGFTPMYGYNIQAADNYGNYIYPDGSVMVWVPAFYYKWGTGSNGLAINVVGIKAMVDFASLAAANTAGYALHRAFYDAGAVQEGVFVDKYLCSNNGGIASSIKNGLPLSSDATHNPFSGLNGAPANFYYGAIAAVKTRGAKFFCNSRFIFAALALLSLAHAQAATAATFCAWYDGAGITNFPKGCNNNALGDANDGTLTFVSDGFPNCAKTGSANVLAKTTHNGMNSGVVDLNGNMWEVNLGMTSNATNFYLLKNSVDIASITSGNTLATDAWGAAGIAAMYDNIGATYGALTASSTTKYYGSATQVFSEALSGTAWTVADAGIPLLGGVGGTNPFGGDYLADYRPNEMCPVAGGYWSYGVGAGVWTLNLLNVRGSSNANVGCRAALYL